MILSSQEKILVKRAKKSVLLVLLLLIAVVLSSVDIKEIFGGIHGDVGWDIVKNTNASNGVSFIQKTLTDNCDKTLLPEGFEDEIGICEACVNIKADKWDGGGVVDFVVRSPVRDAYASLCDQLVAKQWNYTESGRENCGSFSKKQGQYRWLFVSCVGVGDMASVVIQYVNVAEGD